MEVENSDRRGTETFDEDIMEVENSDPGGTETLDEDVIELENSDPGGTETLDEDITEVDNSDPGGTETLDEDVIELDRGGTDTLDEDIVELEDSDRGGGTETFDDDIVELENSDRGGGTETFDDDIVELENSDRGGTETFDDDIVELESPNRRGTETFDEDIMEVENSDPLAGAGSDNDDDVSSRDTDDDLEELAVVVNGKSTASDDANNANHTTIVVNNAKSLVELANSKNDPGKEPTLVIIDTNSIMSGKGPVPMNKRTTGSNDTVNMSRNHNSSIDIPDDAFLIEAPSFIVPYVFEQSGETSMKTYINNLAQKVREVKEAKLAKGEELTAEDEIPEPKKLNSEDYFDSPVGRLLRNIGMNLVQEFVQVDLLKMQKRQGEKEKVKNRSAVMTHITQQSIISLKKNIEESKENNEPFKSKMKKCELCNFRTESELVMSTHLETPHMKNYSYRCNFCTYTTRVPHEIMFHMEAEHNVKSRLERAPAYHQCPSCPFEDNSKAKLNRHILGCIKRFDINKNLIPPMDWDTPAKLPKLPKNRMLPQGMNINPAFLAGVNQQRSLGSYAALASKYMAGNKGDLPPLAQAPKNKPIPGLIRANNPRVMQNPMMNPHMQRGMMMRGRSTGMGQIQPAHLQLTNNQMLQQVVSGQLLGSSQGVANGFLNKLGLQPGPNASGQKSASHQSMRGGVKSNNQSPSISITPLPRQAANPSTSAAAQQKTGGKTSFVICEICDGYIKDLDQLRNHMQWIHKVKIHPKMIYNKPPLNCQKCQFRFFTDQGLERHLLGSHGLVTSSMQDAANKGQDSGRCPLCGKVYQWKLLAHVAKDHNVTLKPAHLSYKCTVCTATFGMYKLFESHVYSAHSVTKNAPRNDRRPQGGSQQQIPNKMNQLQVTPRAMPSSTSQGNSFKPLKINDEITIIPQSMANNNSLAHRNKGSLTITPQSMQHVRRNPRPEDDGIQIIEIDDAY